MLFVAFVWWGMVTLASHSLTSQSDSLRTMGAYGRWEPVYVAGCPLVGSPPGKGLAGGAVGKKEGGDCPEEGLSHPLTSRRPGAGTNEHAHRVEWHGKNKPTPRSSENFPSTHLGE
jgi:hypothetical protein